MSPGGLDVVQADRPYVLDFPRAFSQYVIKLPRGTQPLGGAISPTAARFVRSLARDLLDPDIEPDRVCDEVTARALQELLCGRPAEPALPHRIPDLLRMAVAMIREKMFEPLLSRNRVADELGVSVRTLATSVCDRTVHRSIVRFGIAGWRLPMRRCCRTGPAPTLRKSRYGTGFPNSSHFARRFKARFGVTPGSVLKR